MASHNQYRGYIKLPKKKAYRESIRLDFNAHIDAQLGGTKLDGFSLRLFVLKKASKGRLKEEHPEIGITLTPEEWLDLCDAMKREFESASEARKKFDGMR
ncbi:MAG: hypothetical protein WCV00_20015 [Verrucomicrobiia bacterium]|jgi:hypothetical protein